MKPIMQLYALCIDQLPGYDKDEEYWQNVDKELLTKPMYQDNIRRKNRLDNLKLLNVKELLFDKYINILSEPKVKKISTSVKANKITNIEKKFNLKINPIKTITFLISSGILLYRTAISKLCNSFSFKSIYLKKSLKYFLGNSLSYLFINAIPSCLVIFSL
mgnify:CR=1 FL=1